MSQGMILVVGAVTSVGNLEGFPGRACDVEGDGGVVV